MLKTADVGFLPDYLPHDDDNNGQVIDTLMKRTYSFLDKETWKELVSETPTAIHLYLPVATYQDKSHKRCEKVAQELFPAAAITIDKGPILDLSQEVEAAEKPFYREEADPEEVARAKRRNLVHRLLFNLVLPPFFDDTGEAQ